MPRRLATTVRVALAGAAAGGCLLAAAQTAPSPSPLPSPAPAPAPQPSPAPVPSPTPAPSQAPAPRPGSTPAPAPPAPGGETLAPVEITGSRGDDTDERRRSTAAKIVVGREEIEKFGDSTLGDVLRRLPGVTIGGTPGRGGAIRMRGLGNGYTQILLDGERVPPGFSLDSIPPDQIERIEILRAPTAETGARAIAGTINIVTREGYKARVNDVRLNASAERDGLQGGGSWTRNVVLGDWTANWTVSAFGFRRHDDSVTEIVDDRLADGVRVGEQTIRSRSENRGGGLNANGRLQWRSAVAGGDTVTLTPFLFANRYRYRADATLEQPFGTTPALYDAAATDGDGGVTIARLNAQWNARLDGESRLELRAGGGTRSLQNTSLRRESSGGVPTRSLEGSRDARDRTLTGSAKLVRSLFEDHSLVVGAETEAERLRDDRRTLQDGVRILDEFDEALQAGTTRLAGYAQDEWNITPQWAAHAGLRWESIRTRGSGLAGEDASRNRSSVWTPLFHTTWKPDPKSRDQVRLSLTRSYKSPTLDQLVARPSVSSRYPVSGPNTPTQVDRAGNPDLKPELAQGVDLAVERYLPSSGILSANLFHRRITDYIRNVITLEPVAYSPVPRYVSRPRNVGDATTSGLELEAKFRASDVAAALPRVDVRLNTSLFRSRVKEVPGPDNRLDQQPSATANAGFDYRMAGRPVSFGGNVNVTPGYTARLSETQTASTSRRVVVDAYAAWTVNPNLMLRMTASNLAALDDVAVSRVDGPDASGLPVRESTTVSQSTRLSLQLRVEMKL